MHIINIIDNMTIQRYLDLSQTTKVEHDIEYDDLIKQVLTDVKDGYKINQYATRIIQQLLVEDPESLKYQLLDSTRQKIDTFLAKLNQGVTALALTDDEYTNIDGEKESINLGDFYKAFLCPWVTGEDYMKEVEYGIFRITLLHNLNKYLLDEKDKFDIKILQRLSDNDKFIPRSLTEKKYSDLTSFNRKIFEDNPFLITTFSTEIIQANFMDYAALIVDLPELDPNTFLYIVGHRKIKASKKDYQAQIKKIDSLTVNDLTSHAQKVLTKLYDSSDKDDLQINYLMLFKLYSSYNEVLNQAHIFEPAHNNPYYRKVQTALMRHIEDIFNENLTPEIWFFNGEVKSYQYFNKIQTIFNHIFKQTTDTKYLNLAIKYMDYIRVQFLEIKDISEETIESIRFKKKLQKECLKLFQQLDVSSHYQVHKQTILKMSSGLNKCYVNKQTISLESRLLDALSDQITHDELATIQTKYKDIRSCNKSTDKDGADIEFLKNSIETKLISFIKEEEGGEEEGEVGNTKEAILQQLTEIYNTNKFAYYVITNSNEKKLESILTKHPELTLNIVQEFLLFLQFLVYSIGDSLGFEGFELPQTPETIDNYKVLGSSDE